MSYEIRRRITASVFNSSAKSKHQYYFHCELDFNTISASLKPTGLSLQQFNVLSILNGQPQHTATVNLIKDRLIDRMPNVSRLLNKLMEKGLIQKERNLSDQRVVYVKLTPAGEKLRIQGRQILNLVSVGISDEHANLLNDLLEKMRD